jgi:hypothetical protein
VRIDILSLHLVRIVQKSVFDIFEKIRFLADIVDRCGIYSSPRKKATRSPIAGVAIRPGALGLRVCGIFFEYVAVRLDARCVGIASVPGRDWITVLRIGIFPFELEPLPGIRAVGGD